MLNEQFLEVWYPVQDEGVTFEIASANFVSIIRFTLLPS